MQISVTRDEIDKRMPAIYVRLPNRKAGYPTRRAIAHGVNANRITAV